jgi:tetratricopeptide (TPR) repeat protein
MEQALRAAPGDPAVLGGLAAAKGNLGRFEDAVRDREALAALDPRSVTNWRGLGALHLWLRRPERARPALARAGALAPASPSVWHRRVQAELAAGDLGAARRLLAEARADVPREALVAYTATYYDLGWALADDDARLLLTLGPEAFDGDSAVWALVRAQQHHWRGDAAAARAWGDTAARHTAALARRTPGDAQNHALVGLALALAGRPAAAVAAGERATAMAPVARDAEFGPYYLHLLARTYLLAGEPEKALDALERLMRAPYQVTGAWLRLDPEWAPLRGTPRFERLAAGG